MFKFLKEKIKGAVKNISKEVEEKAIEDTQEIIREEPGKLEEPPLPPQKGFLEPELKKEIKEIIDGPKKEEKKSTIARIREKITTKRISAKEFEDLFWELELALMENNVAVEVIEKIKEELKADLVDNPIDKRKVAQTIENSLQETIKDLFKETNFDLIDKIKESNKPYVIL